MKTNELTVEEWAETATSPQPVSFGDIGAGAVFIDVWAASPATSGTGRP